VAALSVRARRYYGSRRATAGPARTPEGLIEHRVLAVLRKQNSSVRTYARADIKQEAHHIGGGTRPCKNFSLQVLPYQLGRVGNNL